MGYDQYIFYDPVQIKHTCPKCHKVFLDAKAAPCGHILCASCYIQKDQNLLCPLCPNSKELDNSSFHPITEINAEIQTLETWCEYEGCHEHVTLAQRELHLRECKHRNDIKRTTITLDQEREDTEDNSEDENLNEEERRRAKLKRLRRILIRLSITLCVYGIVVVATGIFPHDTGLLPPDTPWCGVGQNGEFLP